MNSFAELQAALAGKMDRPDPGYKTSEQWAAEWGKAVSTAYAVIRQSVRAGLMERRVYRVQTGRRLFPVPHYKMGGRK